MGALEDDRDPDSEDPASDRPAAHASRPRLLFPRLLVGLIVLLTTEVFSGASLGMGLWHPWTLIVTFWLYFAHFFLLTTLAVWTGRTSFWSLYLWGVLFGLYESWITKVIWAGYNDGEFILGKLGPYGYSEISMVFLFHPLMALVVPLAVTCLVCPTLRRYFPDLAWLTGTNRWSRAAQVALVVSFPPIVAINGGGVRNLAGNVLFLTVVLAVLWRLARRGLAACEGARLVTFGRRGFVGLCLYLTLLYAVGYLYLRPGGRPSIPVQAVTFIFYGLAILGLWAHRRREPLPEGSVAVEPRERGLAIGLLALVLGAGLVLTTIGWPPLVALPAKASLAIWTPLGFLLFAAALWDAAREGRAPVAGA